MTQHEPGWEGLVLSDAPSGCRLQRAMFTTYDQPDTTFLAEHLLPVLLGLERRPTEGREQASFLVELDTRLRGLSDRITVVSSMPAKGEARADSPYDWLWRSVRHLAVGATGAATQHAKLWLIHWASDDGAEYLEMVVSSANLQRDAFVGQLQAAWRACVPLEKKPTKANRATWGVLPAFIEALMAACGEDAGAAPFVSLLSRAQCPPGVTVVASVPGTHTAATLRQTPWGAAGLAAVAPPGRGTTTIDVLSPFVGHWNLDSLMAWVERLGGSTERLSLVWIDDAHPWATPTPRWTLPASARNALNASGSTLLDLRREAGNADDSDAFHRQHRVEDPRWSHAKLYRMKRGRSERVLVTSANFSPSAWGDQGPGGALTIRNFELGVVLDSVTWPFADLEPLDPSRALVTEEPPTKASSGIGWARAYWNGTHVTVDVRCAESSPLSGVLRTARQDELDFPRFKTVDGFLRSMLPFLADVGTPRFVALRCRDESITVIVTDDRSVEERDDGVPPDDIDAEAYQALLDEQLFEEYGGPAAAEDDEDAGGIPDDDPPDDGESNQPGDGTEVSDGSDGRTQAGMTRPRDSYEVAAQAAARLMFTIVDGWWMRLQKARARDPAGFEVVVIERNGLRLLEALDRTAARNRVRTVGARLAAEELRALMTTEAE